MVVLHVILLVQLRVTMRYLRDVLQMRFPQLRARAAAAEAEVHARQVIVMQSNLYRLGLRCSAAQRIQDSALTIQLQQFNWQYEAQCRSCPAVKLRAFSERNADVRIIFWIGGCSL